MASTQITTIRAVDSAPVSVVARWRFSSCVMLAVPSSFFRNRFTISREASVTRTAVAQDDDDPHPGLSEPVGQVLRGLRECSGSMGPHAIGRTASRQRRGRVCRLAGGRPEALRFASMSTPEAPGGSHPRQYYETLVEASPTAIVACDPELIVTSWNPAAERLVRVSAEGGDRPAGRRPGGRSRLRPCGGRGGQPAVVRRTDPPRHAPHEEGRFTRRRRAPIGSDRDRRRARRRVRDVRGRGGAGSPAPVLRVPGRDEPGRRHHGGRAHGHQPLEPGRGAVVRLHRGQSDRCEPG